jgi:uncharacterized protein YjbJ (UPF0337 family)
LGNSLVRKIGRDSNRKEANMSNWDEVEGKAKEKAGELTDDESLEREGEVQEKWGEAKEKMDEVEDEVRDKL